MFTRSEWNEKQKKLYATSVVSRRRLPADRFGTDRRPIPPANILILLYNNNIELLLPIGQGHPHQTADNDNNIIYRYVTQRIR